MYGMEIKYMRAEISEFTKSMGQFISFSIYEIPRNRHIQVHSFILRKNSLNLGLFLIFEKQLELALHTNRHTQPNSYAHGLHNGWPEHST